MSNPRVYVGTYGKYNRGSLNGGWVSLLECKSHADFLRKCRALHRGEHDPEYMIQDVEDFPDGLECGEWLSEEDFNDVIAACREEQQEEQDTSLEHRLRAALLMQLGGTKAPVSKAHPQDKALLEEYMQEILKAYSENDKSMLDYHRKKFSGGVRLENGGIVVFDKPSIDHEFCFHDEGPDYEFYKDVTKTEDSLKDYFLQQNLDGMDEEIRALELNCDFPDGEYHSGYDCHDWYVYRVSYSSEREPLNVWKYVALHWSDKERHASWYKDLQPMSDGDRKAIEAGLKLEREKFKKRLQTYLKRYGVKKIRTWTYWADA